jgi:hypothetical protein
VNKFPGFVDEGEWLDRACIQTEICTIFWLVMVESDVIKGSALGNGAETEKIGCAKGRDSDV